MLDIVTERYSIRVGPRFALSLQRTLRIPDDGRTYPLPPGLGLFPLHRVEDFQDRLPRRWLDEGGVFIPMYQREALWLGFRGAAWKPSAVHVSIGGINAVSGLAHGTGLHDDPQDYVVAPTQPWLDGINAGRGTIRQFVAMPLGSAYTVEAALTRREEQGGIQITVYEPLPGIFPDEPPPETDTGPRRVSMASVMGIGAGGTMRQKIYPDPHGIDVWDRKDFGTVSIHILNSEHYREVTGEDPPPTPIDAATYTKHGLPWFDLYDEEARDVGPSEHLAGAKTIADRDAERGTSDETPASIDVPETQIKKIAHGETNKP